jgi:type I restriction enzyme S subunit
MNGEWPKVRLGDVLIPVRRVEAIEATDSYRILGAHWYAKGLYIKDVLTGAQIQAKNLYRIEKNDFVYNRLFGWKGAFAIATKENHGCYVSNEFPSFVVNSDIADGKYIWSYFSRAAVWDEVLSLSTGGTPTSRNRLKEDQLLAMKIPLPSLVEQRRIVARIEELAEKIAMARELRSQIDRETNTFFSKVIGAAFEPYADASRPIGDIFRVTTGGTPSRSNPAFWGGDVKWVSSGEVNFRTIEDTREKVTREGVANSNAKVNPPGTVLLAMIGQGKTRGQCAILNCYASTNQNVAAIHVYETPHNPEYVYWWLYSQYQQSRTIETGTAQPALSGERVKQMPIPLPSPDEQKRVVSLLKEQLQDFEALKTLQSATSVDLNALTPSILDKAFQGGL